MSGMERILKASGTLGTAGISMLMQPARILCPYKNHSKIWQSKTLFFQTANRTQQRKAKEHAHRISDMKL